MGDLSVEAAVRDGVVKAVVHPVERAGDHVVLTVDYSSTEGFQSGTGVDVAWLVGQDINAPGDYVSRVRLVDFAGGRLWRAGWAGQASTTTQESLSPLDGPGQTVTVVTFFGPVDVDSVDVLIPKLGLVSGVPVVEGGPETADLGSLRVRADPVVYEPPFRLDSLVRAYDGNSSATKQGDEQTVVMASDVLFDTDVAELSSEAAARVDEVAAQVAQVASGGEVHVVGHTDDVLSDEYNMDLSVRRATSVADRMAGTLGSSFTVTKEGKGETEPAVEGTDDAARKANRRVEISFTASKPVALSEEPVAVPAATGPVGTGHDSVTYKAVSDDTYTIEVPSVVRRDGYLVGTLVVTAVSGKEQINRFFLSEDLSYSGQRETGGLSDTSVHSSRNVTLMGPQGRVFPARFLTLDSFGGLRANLFADTWIGGTFLKAGEVVTYMVVWPDTGEDSVTVDSPNRFRITDIPVEKG